MAYLLLLALRSAGFTLSRGDEDALIVTPGSRLDGALRDLIMGQRTGLLAALREERQPAVDRAIVDWAWDHWEDLWSGPPGSLVIVEAFGRHVAILDAVLATINEPDRQPSRSVVGGPP